MSAAPLLRLEGLTKHFHGCMRWKTPASPFSGGTIHAVVGENGAGKSTLMKLLVGIHAPDAGQIVWEEAPVTLAGPAAARAMGIDIVFQEIELAPNLTVGESIFLAREPARWGWVDAGEVFRSSARLLASLRVAIRPDAPIEVLSVAEKQLVQIARALAGETRLLILDEPTSALTEHESRRLFEILEDLRRARNDAALRLPQAGRDFPVGGYDHRAAGRAALGTFPRPELDADALIRHMVGPSRVLSGTNSTLTLRPRESNERLKPAATKARSRPSPTGMVTSGCRNPVGEGRLCAFVPPALAARCLSVVRGLINRRRMLPRRSSPSAA